MGKDPAFMLYSQDFLVGVSDLTMEERGQYITMLCLQHQKGHLTKKNIQISIGNVSEDVMEKFSVDEDGMYYNETLEAVIKKRELYSQSRSENGKKGGRPRKEKKEETEIDDWQEMLDFFDNKCVRCGSPCVGRPTKDHIVPRSWGGIDEVSNWQPLCRECNSSKCADHATDYRYLFYDTIPENLRKKWFNQKHTKTICKAHENHSENEYVIKNKIDYNSFINIYNTQCFNLSQVIKITDKRKKAISAFLKVMTTEDFEQACIIANNTPFLCGQSKSGWKANFDFIIKVDNATKIIEGVYSHESKASGVDFMDLV